VRNASRDNRKRKQKQQKCFEDYDWNTPCRTGKVGQLSNQELDKHPSVISNLQLKGKKNDKVRRVTAHALIRMGEVLDTHVSLQRHEVLQDDNSDDDMDNSSDAESDSKDDIVISHLCSSDSSKSERDLKRNQQLQSTCCSTGLWPNPIWAQYCEVVLSLS